MRDNRLWWIWFTPLSRSIGTAIVNVEAARLEIDSAIAWPLFLLSQDATEAKRIDATLSGTTDRTTELLVSITRVADSVDRTPYAGAGSEDGLLQSLKNALREKDIRQLMALSYPVMAPYQDDERLAQYVKWSSWLESNRTNPVRTEAFEEFEGEYALSVRNGIAFPPPIVPAGRIWISGPNEAETGRFGVFYGVINGQWCLLGSPLILNSLTPLRAQTNP